MHKHITRNHLKTGGTDLPNKRHLSINPNKKPAGHRSKQSAGFNGLLMGGYHGK